MTHMTPTVCIMCIVCVLLLLVLSEKCVSRPHIENMFISRSRQHTIQFVAKSEFMKKITFFFHVCDFLHMIPDFLHHYCKNLRRPIKNRARKKHPTTSGSSHFLQSNLNCNADNSARFCTPQTSYFFCDFKNYLVSIFLPGQRTCLP